MPRALLAKGAACSAMMFRSDRLSRRANFLIGELTMNPLIAAASLIAAGLAIGPVMRMEPGHDFEIVHFHVQDNLPRRRLKSIPTCAIRRLELFELFQTSRDTSSAVRYAREGALQPSLAKPAMKSASEAVDIRRQKLSCSRERDLSMFLILQYSFHGVTPYSEII
jgi:hypothetical protein